MNAFSLFVTIRWKLFETQNNRPPHFRLPHFRPPHFRPPHLRWKLFETPKNRPQGFFSIQIKKADEYNYQHSLFSWIEQNQINI